MIKAADILEALIIRSDDKCWATELALFSGTRRVDFWTLEPTRSQKFRATAYEIKVSRADFRRDDDEKQAGACAFSDRFFYVTPPAMLSLDEVPAWAGLLEWDGSEFRPQRKAPMRVKCEPTWEFFVSFLRNSGDARRDVGLLKAEAAFLKHEFTRRDREQRARDRREMEKMMRRLGINPGMASRFAP